jgi:hypothetical protein
MQYAALSRVAALSQIVLLPELEYSKLSAFQLKDVPCGAVLTASQLQNVPCGAVLTASQLQNVEWFCAVPEFGAETKPASGKR